MEIKGTETIILSEVIQGQKQILCVISKLHIITSNLLSYVLNVWIIVEIRKIEEKILFGGCLKEIGSAFFFCQSYYVNMNPKIYALLSH